MDELTVQILLAEYDRLKGVEQFIWESYERSVQLYLAVITAAVGAFLFLAETQMPLSSLRLSLGLLLGATLLIGEVTYLKMLGVDLYMVANGKAFELIQDKFIQANPELVNAFLKDFLDNAEKFNSWSSIRGIINRAFTVSGEKTIVVLLNCLVSSGVVIIIIWPGKAWAAFAIGIVITALAGFMHTIYASWRYKREAKQFF